MTNTTFPGPASWRRLMSAALIAAAATLAGIASGDPAVASAEPREWDIASYDQCVAKTITAEDNGEISHAEASKRRRDCCVESGGVVQGSPQGGFTCVAPPKEAVARPVPPGAITHDLTSDPVTPPPGEITQTLEPVP